MYVLHNAYVHGTERNHRTARFLGSTMKSATNTNEMRRENARVLSSTPPISAPPDKGGRLPFGANSLDVILADERLTYVGGSCVRVQSKSTSEPSVTACVEVVMPGA